VIPVELYPPLKATHVGLVLASGALFVVRGAAVLAGRPWAMARPLRLTSYTIDTGLLVAGILLAVMLAMSPSGTPWLAVKLALLPVYIVIGSMALKRARSARAAWYAAAVVVYLFMISVARQHDPLGFLRSLAG
jgi:uncharacterized membrane protein SirB2